jgi:hypothetical protein
MSLVFSAWIFSISILADSSLGSCGTSFHWIASWRIDDLRDLMSFSLLSDIFLSSENPFLYSKYFFIMSFCSQIVAGIWISKFRNFGSLSLCLLVVPELA